MTGLLVSVRDGREAVEAMSGGAALIDVKEPLAGALGRASATQWQQVADRVAGRVPVSVAWGELLDDVPDERLALPPLIAFAKCGLAGCGPLPDWPRRWAAWAQRLPSGVVPVAVSYADWRRTAAPPPARVLACAADCRCRAILWDTGIKDGTCLVDHLDPEELGVLVRAARDGGMLVVLAGSLKRQHVPALLPLRPDYLAVRGAVCDLGREGAVQRHRVEQFVTAIASCEQVVHNADQGDEPHRGERAELGNRSLA